MTNTTPRRRPSFWAFGLLLVTSGFTLVSLALVAVGVP